MPTAITIIKAALLEIGVRASGEVLPADEASEGMLRLNRLINRRSAENLSLYTITRSTPTLTANTATFSIGPGGTIAMARRPVFFEQINFVDTSQAPDLELPLTILTEAQWEAITLKAQTSTYPQAVYWNPTFPGGGLSPWPIPTSATLTWALYFWADLAPFATLTTNLDMPPAYEDDLTLNLALILCPSYAVQPHPVLVKGAAEAYATVKRANYRERRLTFGADVLGDQGRSGPGRYTILTDQ
jgi:hypothetical protein